MTTLQSITILLAIMAVVQSKSVSSETEAQTNPVQDIQNFADVNATDKLEKQTLELMSLPRHRNKRYILKGGRWPKNNLTYKILNYPSNTSMTNAEVDAEIAKAFAVWSTHTVLTFTRQEICDAADIEMRFAAGAPFDGKGNKLAYAYYPIEGGDIHFDDSERWTMSSNEGTNLFQTAAHEIGHALGLFHSNVKSSVMAPAHHGYKPDFKLDPDDIEGIKAIYERKPPAPSAELCRDPKIDAIFNLIPGETYVFKGDLYYQLEGNSVAHGYPKKISERWEGLPGNIDAVVDRRTNRTIFHKDNEFWYYNWNILDGSFEFPPGFGVPIPLDTALHRSHQDNLIYYFKGKNYVTFNEDTRERKKYLLSDLGLPSDLDAAFEDENGHSYFFKDDEYYRFDDTTGKVAVNATAPYPRKTAQYWFGC